MVFFLYGKVLYQYKLYDKFDTAPPKVTATVMLVLAALQIVLMVRYRDWETDQKIGRAHV